MISGVTLKKNEQLVHVQRRVLLYHAPLILIGSALLILPFFFLFAALPFGWFGMVPVLGVSGAGLIVLLRVRSVWRGTACVLTDRRIIWVETSGFVKRRVHTAQLKDVQDVAYRIHGVLGSLFRVGAVRVRFRGVVPNMRFERMRRPQELHALVRELVKLPKKSKPTSEKFKRVRIDEVDEEL